MLKRKIRITLKTMDAVSLLTASLN